MTRTARCACGQAQITLDGEPAQHNVCHCANCRCRTGSAFGISAYFPKEAVVERSGEMACYAFHHAAWNHDQERYFCQRCGTTLYWYLSSRPDLIGVAGGCFTEPPLEAPRHSASHSQKLDWVGLPADWLASG